MSDIGHFSYGYGHFLPTLEKSCLSASMTLNKPESMPVLVLTRREREILTKITDGLTNQQITDQLFVDVGTVSSHRNDVQNTTQLIKLAIINKLI